LENVATNNGAFEGISLKFYDENTARQSHFGEVVDAVINHMETRLGAEKDPARPILEASRIFDLRDWPRNRMNLVKHGNEEIQVLADHFSSVLTRLDCDIQLLKTEWTHLKASIGSFLIRQPARQLDQLLTSTLFVECESNKKHYPNISLIAEIVFILPVSTSVCERGFSAVKRKLIGGLRYQWRCYPDFS